jgi:hypothetical protein
VANYAYSRSLGRFPARRVIQKTPQDDSDMRKARTLLPPGISGWYNRKMARANTPRTEAQKKVLEAYSNYLLKDLATSGT